MNCSHCEVKFHYLPWAYEVHELTPEAKKYWDKYREIRSQDRIKTGNDQEPLEEKYVNRRSEVKFGSLTPLRRSQLLQRWTWDDDGSPEGLSREDYRLHRYNNNNDYKLTLPSGLYALLTKYGHYISYANPADDIRHDVTHEIALQFNDFLRELVGIPDHHWMTN